MQKWQGGLMGEVMQKYHGEVTSNCDREVTGRSDSDK